MSQGNDDYIQILEAEAAITVEPGRADEFVPMRSFELSYARSMRSFDAEHPDSMTMNTALQKVGGFDRFQFLALTILTILRNIGSPQIYTFALGTLLPTQI